MMFTVSSPLEAVPLSLLSICLSISSTLHAVLNKRDNRAVIGWVGLIWLAPFIGPVAYFTFGVNRIQRRAESLNKLRPEPPVILNKAEDENRRLQFIEESPALIGQVALEKKLTHNDLLPGNTITPLRNGDAAYPAMIEAIDSAEQSISFMSYIFDHDRAGVEFLDALIRAKARGVEIRVLIDSVGAQYSKPNMIRRLKKEGLRAAAFLPIFSASFGGFHYLNLRNHRKILVVDGKTGFTGGTNIRAEHRLDWKPEDPVQCLHFKLVGPVVAQLQSAFTADWAFTTKEVLQGTRWYPDIDYNGTVWARGIPDGPDENFEVSENTFLGALASAQKSVDIVTPYFLPESALIHALNVTSLRGVEVRIIIPAKPNIRLVEWACPANFKQLIAKGCHLYLTPQPFDHTKLMIVDGVYSLIGSTNWDPRSLRLNFEFNVGCYDDELAKKLLHIIEEKIGTSERVTMKGLIETPLLIRIRSGLARLLTPYI